MDKAYADTVRLMLNIAPDVFASNLFALKGGTAINLFVRDMPRLSIDLDVVYKNWQTPRDQALKEISLELTAISKRLNARRLTTRLIANKDQSETKLLVDNGDNIVKVEVNTVFRGTVLATRQRQLRPKTSEKFSIELKLPILNVDELYGGKLVAAMDRQHPRDLFDVQELMQSEQLSDDIVECFVTYLAGHNRPVHEVLFSKPKDITSEYHGNFAGMTQSPITLETLLETRDRLMRELPRFLTRAQRQFLIGLSRAQPDWSLLKCPHAQHLPALRWKLSNIEQFAKRRPKDFESHARELEDRLGSIS